MTDKERFIPTLEKIEQKVNADQVLTKSEKAFLSAVISNQINVQHGYADLISYEDDVEIYGFEETITYQKKQAS